jgi:heme-degrading monooxygenase HmoA
MFARAVVIKVQPGCDVELTRTFEQEVIPRFQKEKDFRGLLAFTVPDGTEALSLSLWDQKETSRGFFSRSFAALTALARVALGKPSVQVCEVGNFPLQTLGQVTDHGEGIEATADLKIYRSALQPFKVAQAQAPRGRGFPLIWCIINSFSFVDATQNEGAE